MLPPNRRELYLSALRPTPGFQLDCAIGTTYSLDLITLLSLPLSFALLDMTDHEGKLLRDPVALLHSLRAYANRLTIFCQAGGIHVPTQRHPVDLEQREGRVHRFKGHFIRKNLARAYGIAGTKAGRDPWAAVFRTALDQRSDAHNDLVPFWIFDGPSKIERRLPVLPLSREASRLSDLKQSLALYRLTFGQPRQEELLEFLKRRSSEEAETSSSLEQHIDLRPPVSIESGS